MMSKPPHLVVRAAVDADTVSLRSDAAVAVGGLGTGAAVATEPVALAAVVGVWAREPAFGASADAVFPGHLAGAAVRHTARAFDVRPAAPGHGLTT